MLFKVAWRNIWRNKMRSTVVIASVAVGLFAGMFMMAFFRGFMAQDIRSAVETQLAHIQIHNPAFGDDKDVNDTIDNAASIIAGLKKDTNVKSVSGRIITMGMITSPSAVSGVEIHGVIPADEKNISVISKSVTEGNYFNEGKKNEIVIGKKLADKLGVKLHNKIVLTFQSKAGDITAGSFRIAGIFHSGNSTFDEMTVFTNFNDISLLLGTNGGIHEIAIMLKDNQRIQGFEESLKKQYGKQLIQRWDEIEPELALITGILDQMMYIIMGIILLALMFGIINTMLMAVLERQREFGMLMAIGMNKTRVFFMVMYESVMLTCVGIPIGVLLTITIVNYANRHGIDLSSFSKGLEQFGMGTMVYPELNKSMFLPVVLMTTFTAILSAIYPAIKALQFKPAVAIHKI